MTFKRLYHRLTNSFSPSKKTGSAGNSTKPVETRNGFDLQGSVGVVSIEGIFQLLYLTNLTGVLVLKDLPRQATFHFTNGQLTWGSLHSENTQIGQRLLKSKVISEEQLNECLSIQDSEKRKKRIGELLLSKGFLQADILHESLKDQAREAFFSVLSWRTGTFSFVAQITQEKDDVSVSERIDHLLLEGAVHIDKSADGPTTAISEDSTLNFFKAD